MQRVEKIEKTILNRFFSLGESINRLIDFSENRFFCQPYLVDESCLLLFFPVALKPSKIRQNRLIQYNFLGFP